MTATTTGLTSTDGNGGSLISKITPPVNTSEYEVEMTLTLGGSGYVGTFDVYLDASSNALSAPTPAGTYYALELAPTFSTSGCSALLSTYKRVSSTVTELADTTVPCSSGMVIRAVRTANSELCYYINGVMYAQVTDASITSGMPGIGVRHAAAGNSISSVSLGPIATVPPNPVNAQSVGTSPFPRRIDFQWQPATDVSNGPGLAYYSILRNGTLVANTASTEFSDETVASGTTYTYSIVATDYHQNTATTTLSVTTPPSGAIDPRRVGVRHTGSYWGSAGEQIDTLSGNLNFSTQLFEAMGRGGWGVGLNLSYNSQLWRQDPGGTWKLNDDVGYGLGWRLQAGSITPYYDGYFTLDHYLFIDATGAAYHLTVNTSGVWTSTEGIYISFNSANNTLYFPDGSFWVMGAISAGTEQDAGTMYPTQMEDTNGNQIFIRYNAGLGVTWTNSSARIEEIEDVRAVYNSNTGTYQSYTFTYNTDAIPHLTQINNVIGKGSESYTLGYLESQPLSSPFTPTVSYGTTTLLQALAVTSLGYGTSFTYDSVTNSGELTSVTSPLGGKIRWAYTPFTFSGSRTLREVQDRYLTMTSGGTESSAYTLSRNASDSNLTVHSSLVLDDPSGIGERAWTFSTSGAAWELGLLTQYEERPSASQSTHPLKRQAYTWVEDSALNPYVGTALTTLDPTGANVQSQVTQTLDTHGNVTQTNDFNYGNLTTAARTYNYTYLTGTNYTSLNIFNRLLSASVTNGTQNVTLVTNTYDNQTLTNISTLNEHDSNYGTSFTYRGNLTVTTPVGGPSKTLQYDITGTAVSATDGLGHTVTVTTSATNNYAAPTAVTPNSNTNLQTTASYTQWLAPSSIVQPNSATSSTIYDTFGRPQQSTSVYGAQTNYTYSQNGTLPMVVTATTNGHWTETTLDGFGRTIEFDRGYNNGSTPVTVSTVKSGYALAACSPLGNMIQVSQPYAPSGTVYWTTYSYDGRGRKLNTVLPDGASTTTYSYSGNTSTVTDPASNWKQDVYDVFGNLTTVNEPNPAGGANLSTSYTYDVMNHLTGVSMTRGSTTQTRTFTYDPTTQRLSSQKHPETGTTSYTYNSDGTVATKTDSKGQVTQWNYDTYQRVTSVQFFPTPGNEDTCQGWNLTYDVNPPNPPIQSTNALGRLTFFQWRGSCTEGAGYQYSYTPGGLVNAKSGPGILTYTYDGEGKVTSYSTPSWGTYNYSFDLMDRPIGLTDLYSTQWMQGVQYGPSDQITQRTRRWFNGSTYVNMTETRQYNNLGQVTRITLPGVLDQEYDYSPTKNNGRITQTIDHIAGETVSYTYDSLNRLATAASSLGWGESYTYDGFGNLTDETVTAGSAPALHVTVDPTTNRLTGSAYTYDANGNLTAVAGAFTATYNVNNKLYTISPSAGGTQVYYYDQNSDRGLIADGYGNIIGGGFYGAYGEHVSTGYLGSDSYASSDYIFFGTEPIWNSFVNSAGVTVYSEQVAQDRLGSVRVWGTQTTNLFPYGVEYTTTGQDHEKFATYIRDSFTGLDYARNRFYSSTLGRFTSADTTLSSVSLANPLSWNRYAYVNGDPVNSNDPTGLDDCSYANDQMDSMDAGDGSGAGCIPSGGGWGGGGATYGDADITGYANTQAPSDPTPVLTGIGPGGDDPCTDPATSQTLQCTGGDSGTSTGTGQPVNVVPTGLLASALVGDSFGWPVSSLFAGLTSSSTEPSDNNTIGTPKNSSQCGIYLQGGTASGAGLNIVCRNAPEYPWSQRMRGCLQTLYNPSSGYVPIFMPVPLPGGSAADLNTIIPGTGAHVVCAVNAFRVR